MKHYRENDFDTVNYFAKQLASWNKSHSYILFPSEWSGDSITWSSSPSGIFKLKEAYMLANIEEKGCQTEPFRGDWIWKVLTIPKVKCFLWQCYHKSILVRATLAARRMEIPPLWPIYNEAPESIIHAFRDCHFAQYYWNSFPSPIQATLFYGANLLDWLRLNCL